LHELRECLLAGKAIPQKDLDLILTKFKIEYAKKHGGTDFENQVFTVGLLRDEEDEEGGM